MDERVIVVTCSEPDALPFLRAFSASDLAHMTLVATYDVVRSAERQTPVSQAFVIGGLSTLEEARGLLARPGAHVTVVVAPDPWGPFAGKGFVRARQVLPFVLPDVGVDVIELNHGGRSGRVRRGVGRSAFTSWIRRRELACLADFLVHFGMVTPEGYRSRPAAAAMAFGRLAIAPLAALVTLARILPFIAGTEARARMKARSS